MRRSAPRGAVFTPAMPHMEFFLSRHVRQDHPLRHHPLWLSEKELSTFPQLKVDLSGLQHTEKDNAKTYSPMLVAHAPTSLLLYNMDQLLPESETRWLFPSVTEPMSVTTKRPYGPNIQKKLERFRKARGFESNWWGTRKRWSANGGHVDLRAIPCALPVSITTRFLHISLLLHGEEVLAHSFISGKTGAFMTWWGVEKTSCSFSSFCSFVEGHFKKHVFKSPLYFSKRALLRAGIAVRPDAEPLDLSTLNNESWYTNIGEPGPLLGNVISYQQYYHISQVIFPENYRIPLNVVESERLNPGMPIHGVTGSLLGLPELRYEALVSSPSPELASIIAPDDDMDHASSTSELVSPNTLRGRSLWYLPHDVLEIGALVDVNAVPVEVATSKAHTSTSRHMYNVEQLSLPLEGYKAAGRIALMEPIAAEHEPDCVDGDSFDEADAWNNE